MSAASAIVTRALHNLFHGDRLADAVQVVDRLVSRWRTSIGDKMALVTKVWSSLPSSSSFTALGTITEMHIGAVRIVLL